MFSIIKSWMQNEVIMELTLEELKVAIENNPNKDEILELHGLNKNALRYDEIKGSLPCIKCHGTFSKNYAITQHFIKSSGYVFFDIDEGNIEEIKKDLIKNHSDKIVMLGKSVGGKGIFFYVKINNPEVITSSNFLSIQNYIKDNIFQEYPIDNNAKGINRNQVLPYDNDLYFNNQVTGYTINKDIVIDNLKNVQKGITGSIKLDGKKCNSTCDTICTFSDIAIINKKIKWKTTTPDTNGLAYKVFDWTSMNLFIPKNIKDGDNKHKVYRGIVNTIVFNNPDLELKDILGFINFINSNYTNGHPMKLKELIWVVTSTYNHIKETGEIKGGKIKRVAVAEWIKGSERQRLGCLGYSEYRINDSVKAITVAVDLLKEHNETISVKNVAELLEGRKSIATIKRYWSKVVKDASIKISTSEKIENAIKKLKANNEKVTNKKISELSGLSLRTVQSHRIKPVEIPANPVLPATQINKPIKQSVMKKEPLNTQQNEDRLLTNEDITNGLQPLWYYQQRYGNELGQEMFEGQWAVKVLKDIKPKFRLKNNLKAV